MLVRLAVPLLACWMLVLCAAADVVGPREPLTFRNSGLYCGWNDYVIGADSPFDFLIVQASVYEGQDNTQWRDWLRKARLNGKRVIADVNPQVKNQKGEYFGLAEMTSESDSTIVDRLAQVASAFLTQVGEENLYAITLAEENIFWNGREQQLNSLYERIKTKHSVPVYQWYSPSSKGSVPGVTGYPHLKSNGWIADEYHLDQPFMERAMRGYRMQQKPLFQIIWAGGDGQSVPFIDKRFAEQVEVCRKYNIPTAYFTWGGSGKPWGWETNTPKDVRTRFELVRKAAVDAKSSEIPDTQTWDHVPWKISVIELGFSSPVDQVPSFREDFANARALRFVNDSDVAGFANLRWNSQALELCPREPGPARSSVTYNFKSPFPISKLRINIAGFTKAGRDAVVSASALDPAGKVIATDKLSSGTSLKLELAGKQVNGQTFRVELELSGTAAAAADVIAGISSLEVEADVQLPKEKVTDLDVGPATEFAYQEDLSSLRLFHTAEVRNVDKFRYSTDGLFVSTAPGVLEVVQKFRASRKIRLSDLHLSGSADESSHARVGIGVSTNGSELLAKQMSKGCFSGELDFSLAGVSQPIEAEEFYIHLFLEGDYEMITSYRIRGAVVAPQPAK